MRKIPNRGKLFSFGGSQVEVGRRWVMNGALARWALSHLPSLDSAEIPAPGSHITQMSSCFLYNKVTSGRHHNP